MEQDAPRLFDLLKWLLEGEGERPRIRRDVEEAGAETPATAPPGTPAENAGAEQESEPAAAAPSLPGQPPLVDLALMEVVLPSQLPFLGIPPAPADHLELNGDWSRGLFFLGGGQTLLFMPDSGDLAGQAFLLVDVNGEAGYQAGRDFMFNLAGVSLEMLPPEIFI